MVEKENKENDVGNETDEKIRVCAVSFRNSISITYCEVEKNVRPIIGKWCLVKTEFGIDSAKVVRRTTLVSRNRLPEKLYKVIKMASDKDVEIIKKISQLEEEGYKVCKQKIREMKLQMYLTMVRVLFDKSKIIFYYTAEKRIDFRELVRELASIFKTRIEMRQIGVRDEAQLHGGFGPCGRPLCCGVSNYPFSSVTIRMTKDQNINLNSVKISGVCGRLLCCLSYEHPMYLEYRENMPDYGDEVEFEGEKGVVIFLDILKHRIKVKMNGGSIIDLDAEQVKIIKKRKDAHKAEPETFLESYHQPLDNSKYDELKEELEETEE